jgi:hypothetical protein
MKNSFISFIALAFMASATLIGCSDDPATPSKAGTYYGQKQALGNDSVQSYIELDDAGEPLSVGIKFGAKAIQGLDTNAKMLMLEMPTGASVAPYSFLQVDWNPFGHPPVGVYTQPHFDFHFYMAPQSEVMNIPAPPALDMTPMDTKYLPANYITDSVAIPMMGVHWVDITSPEFNGGQFTQTFIYGTYKGNVTFIEPMITKAYLESKPDTAIAIKQPTAWQKSGYYPKEYHIHYEAASDSYVVELHELTKN